MAVFTVHQPPLGKGENAPDPTRFHFVRDGFYVWGFLLSVFWMLRHKLWLVAALFVALAVLIEIGLRWAGIGVGIRSLVLLALCFLAGLEGATLRRWTLSLRGYIPAGVVIADNRDEAERRFFLGWTASRPAKAEGRPASTVPAPSAPAVRPRNPAHDVIGSFPATRAAAMTTAIVDYGSGNLHSAAKAFERAAREHAVNGAIVVTSDPDALARADRIVLPGVGAFADCKRGLQAVPGMVEALNENVRKKGKPFFGICVGMQLMAERGHEKEVIDGLGWIAGEVHHIHPSDPALKVPHMGWNTLQPQRPHPLFDGLSLGENGLHAYFVHSYELKAADPDDLVAQAEYGGPVTAIVGRDNMVGTQFHPEKSQKLGLALIANFLKWKP